MTAKMQITFVTPGTIDYGDPALPPGLNADKLHAGIDVAATKMAERGWVGHICNIPPNDDGIATFENPVASATYHGVVIGAGLRLPPRAW